PWPGYSRPCPTPQPPGTRGSLHDLFAPPPCPAVAGPQRACRSCLLVRFIVPIHALHVECRLALQPSGNLSYYLAQGIPIAEGISGISSCQPIEILGFPFVLRIW